MKASSSLESEDLAVHLYPGAVTIQGVLRRKTLLKEGKKTHSSILDKILGSIVWNPTLLLCCKISEGHREKTFQIHPEQECVSRGLDGDDGRRP